MPRNKKRIQKKKTIIKKTIKKIIKHNHGKDISQTNKTVQQTKTSEQQSRDNEMLKVMLGRQQQIIPGQTQQNDKYQQQLDTLNKLYNTQLKDNDTKKNQIAELKDMINDSRKEVKRIEDEARHQEKLNKQTEKNIKEREKAEERKEKAIDKKEELEAAARKFDEKTEEGKYKKEMSEMDEKLRWFNRMGDKIDDEIKQNPVFTEYKKKKEELEIEKARVRALDEILNSKEYKGASEFLQKTNKELYLQQYRRQQTEEIIKKKIEISNIKAETKGQEAYIAELTKGRPEHVLNKDGSFRKDRNGGYIYKKDDEGKIIINNDDNILNDYRKKMAEQISRKQEADIEHASVLERLENTTNVIKEANKALIDAENKERELMQARNIIESEQYKNKLDQLAKLQDMVATKEAQNESNKQAIEQQKKIMELNARGIVLSNFDPSNTNPDAVQAQMGEYIEQIKGAWDSVFSNKQQEIERGNRINKLDEALSNVLNRYEEGSRATANENLMRLINIKTGDKLMQDMKDWDIVNMNKGIEFINMINRFDPNLLLNDDDLNGFVEGEEFNEFKWDITEGTQK